jgi:2-hydroxyglutarate dehydrogenase
VVGAGIVGLATARELARRHDGLRVCVLERENELPGLAELERRGRENGVQGLRRLAPGELREIEPHAAGVAALHSPHTGVVDFTAVAASFAREVKERAGAVITGCTVREIKPVGEWVEVAHVRGMTTARAAVSCAGALSDRLAVACGAPADPRIVPFRGAYLRLRPERRHLVRSQVYPVPDPSLPFLGVHLSRLPSGEVTIGPTALLAARRIRSTLAWPGTWRLMRRFWRTGATELRHAASRASLARAAARYVPELRPGDVVPGPYGVRAQALARDGSLLDDFAFEATDRALHVRNAPSPAATSALAIARHVADRAERELGL